MANWKRGLGGAASGAAGGAAIGSAIPGIGTAIGAGVGGLIGGIGSLFGGGDDEAEAAFQRNRQMYEDLLNNYQGPDSDPQYQAQLQGLGQMANGGLTAADRASMLEAYGSAQQMAQGREGAIQQNQLMRGGGVASSGQMAGLQAQSAALGAQRYQSAGMQQAGNASNRAMQARLGYLQQVQNNKQSLNNYKLSASAGAAGANTAQANYYGAKGAADSESFHNGLDSLGAAGMYFSNQQQEQQRRQKQQQGGGYGGGYSGGGSLNPSGYGYG